MRPVVRSFCKAILDLMIDPNWHIDITESQRTCLHLVGAGMSSKEIAIETGLSPRTVDQYVNRAASILGASNRREASRILASLENGELNKFQLQSRQVAISGFSGSLSGVNRRTAPNGFLAKLLHWVPPIGGERHDLDTHERIREIIKAAIISAVGFGSIVAIGAWLQTLFT